MRKKRNEMIVNGNRSFSPDGKVQCDLNAAVYAINCGSDMQYIQLTDMDDNERLVFNKNCEKFGLNTKMVKIDEINHDLNHELWHYDAEYDKINLEDYFLSKCTNDEQKERVLMELKLYNEYNMNKLLRCMIWLVNYFTEHNIFWGLGRGSSVSSYCLYLIGLHLVDSLKYDLDIHEFLKWN